MRNRLRGNIRCGGSPDHDGRHGLSVGPPDHRPSLPLSQRKKINRIYICVPVFAVSLALLVWQIQNPDGFNTIWKYFGWANQTLAVFTLWTLTVYLAQEKKAYVLTLVPALFMTVVCVSFLMVSDIAFALPPAVGYAIGGGVGLATALWFMVWLRKMRAGARE